MSTTAAQNSRSSDPNLTQASLTCSHTAALVPLPTSHVNCTASSYGRRVHRRTGHAGCWMDAGLHEGVQQQVHPAFT